LGTAKLRKLRILLSSFSARIRDVARARQYDIIFIHREAFPIGPPIFERLICWRNRNIVYDFDDTLHLPPEHRRRKGIAGCILEFLEYPNKCRDIIKLSSRVIVGNPFLHAYASKYNSAVTLIPTSIDTDAYLPKNHATKEPVCIGWSGSYSTIQHLKTKETVLLRICRDHRVQIKVVGSSLYRIPGAEVKSKDWNLKEEIDDLSQMDIGIMPLPDNDLTRGKCGLKALQYMAMGIPTVCSPVGVNSEIIQDGVNGYLADSDDEWYEKLSRLVVDSALRARIGEAGRKTVEEKFSKNVVAAIYYRVLNGSLR
jgi:glycosyltransferase involved in cell wall biosynthesis